MHRATRPASRPSARSSSTRSNAASRFLSIYAFSRENWARERNEVETLFSLLDSAIRDYTPDLVRQGVRVQLLGRIDELSSEIRASIEDALAATSEGFAHDPECVLQLLGALGDRRRGPAVHRRWPRRRRT